MAKIGRNEQCPCGSGKKFKRCCLGKQLEQAVGLTEAQKAQVSLKNAISKIQETASKGVQKVNELGVFVLFSTRGGDAWLLEVTEMDALKVAANREIIHVELEENPETIEIIWTHTFVVKNKQFITTSYKDKSIEEFPGYPTHPIQAAIKRIKKKYSPELLESVHVDQELIPGDET
jgi:hypothetical protein